MTSRRLLGYCNGAIVPYLRSQTNLKVQCAEQQKLCKRTKLHVATWGTLRACLQEVLESGHNVREDGVSLSSLKRSLRVRFGVDLSETALGHAAVSDLFKDARLLDLCTVRLVSKGYVLFPKVRRQDFTHGATSRGEQDAPTMAPGGSPLRTSTFSTKPLPTSVTTRPGFLMPRDASEKMFSPQTSWQAAVVPDSSPARLSSVAVPRDGTDIAPGIANLPRDGRETPAWDLTCNVLGMGSGPCSGVAPEGVQAFALVPIPICPVAFFTVVFEPCPHPSSPSAHAMEPSSSGFSEACSSSSRSVASLQALAAQDMLLDVTKCFLGLEEGASCSASTAAGSLDPLHSLLSTPRGSVHANPVSMSPRCAGQLRHAEEDPFECLEEFYSVVVLRTFLTLVPDRPASSRRRCRSI